MSAVKRLLAVSLFALAACGGTDATAPEQGGVLFKVDALTCVGTGSITFFIDGSAVGTQTLSGGQESQTFITTVGDHAVGARENGGTGYVWPTQTITVVAKQIRTELLTC